MTRLAPIALALLTALTALLGLARAQERPWTPLPSPPSAACPGGLCQSEALAPLFRALDGRAGDRVRIVQFGDSHTAGRRITGALESRLKARFPRRDIRLEPIGRSGATLADLVGRPLPLLEGPPDLIIIAYGANEGFDDRLDPVAYERLLRRQIARLRAEAPGAALLILGAPDALRAEAIWGRTMSTEDAGTCPGDPDRRWRAPPRLAAVREVQARVAADAGVAFWDWLGRMGGVCSAHRLTRAGPGETGPMMRGDHVHFTAAGADWIGSLLHDDLIAAGEAWYARVGRHEAGRHAAAWAGGGG